MNFTAFSLKINNLSLQVFEEVFREKRSQMEGRLRGEKPEQAKYGVIDEQLQRVERQLKVRTDSFHAADVMKVVVKVQGLIYVFTAYFFC